MIESLTKASSRKMSAVAPVGSSKASRASNASSNTSSKATTSCAHHDSYLTRTPQSFVTCVGGHIRKLAAELAKHIGFIYWFPIMYFL